MKIAVLSGKGGTGKTFVATNLAVTSQMMNMSSTYIDCDVEEPNGYLFLKPEDTSKEEVCTYVPHFDVNICIGCKKCISACRFNALIFIKNTPRLFPDICHGCGACELVCEAKAVIPASHSVGFVEVGSRGGLQVITGIMHMGEASAVPVIKKTLEIAFSHKKKTILCSQKNLLQESTLEESVENHCVIIDCPPGSACSVMESVQESDFCILVVEPTAFGLHNFKMVHELVSLLKKPCGIVINKIQHDTIYQPLEDFCLENNISVLARFEDKLHIATLTSNARVAVDFDEELAKEFIELYQKLQKSKATIKKNSISLKNWERNKGAQKNCGQNVAEQENIISHKPFTTNSGEVSQ